MTFLRAGLALVLAVAFAPKADAGLINFNPTGGATVGGFNPGTINNVISFNLAAGDAVARASITGGGLTVGSTFQVYYQTVITGFNTTGGAVNPNGLNSAYQLTEVSTFTETVQSISANNATAIFSLAPGPNRTSIYFEDLTAPGAIKANPATGLGFTNGTLIMNLTTNQISSNYTDTTKLGTTPGTAPLNQSGSGDYAGVTTDQGIGNVTINANVNAGYNTSFFVSPVVVASLFQSGINTPFVNVAPSTGFNDPFAPGAPTIVPVVGANNGTSGPDFLLQIAAASQSFSVPEPASVAMTLLGLGGAGLGSFAARRRRPVA